MAQLVEPSACIEKNPGLPVFVVQTEKEKEEEETSALTADREKDTERV